MGVVRYVALIALVLWLAGLVAVVAGDMLRRIDLLAYACGAVVIVCLLVMKFVGPPPRAFLARLALVLAMVAVAAYSGWRFNDAWAMPPALIGVEMALGAMLLLWYARE